MTTSFPFPGENMAATHRAKSSAMIRKLISLGLPKAVAETFPLTPHEATGRWCKKLPTPHGPKVVYFGALNDWKAAKKKYEAEKEGIINGQPAETRKSGSGLRLIDLCNQFLRFKRTKVNSGELTLRSWQDYHGTAEKLMDVLGDGKIVESLTPADFERMRASYTCKVVRLSNEICRARIIFRFAFDQSLIVAPVRFGEAFKRPTRTALRVARAKDRRQHGSRMFSSEELRSILDQAPQPLHAMILLGCCAGFSNMDCATLPISAVDLDNAIIDFPRPKTGIPRHIPLWPETVASLREWLDLRPEAKYAEDANLVFLTGHRRAWHRKGRFAEEGGVTVVKGVHCPLTKVFGDLLAKTGVPGKRRNFLALRHGFRTVARGARDREAVDALMGHADGSMAAHYLEDTLPIERLMAVTDYVRAWLNFESKNG
jgi:integrase